MTDPRPAEGPDREAHAFVGSGDLCARDGCGQPYERNVHFPTPPAPGDDLCAHWAEYETCGPECRPAPGGDTADRALAAELTKAWERIAFLERMLRAAALARATPEAEEGK
jgi:hypothetical protein